MECLNRVVLAMLSSSEDLMSKLAEITVNTSTSTDLGAPGKCAIVDLFPFLGLTDAVRGGSIGDFLAWHEVRPCHDRCSPASTR